MIMANPGSALLGCAPGVVSRDVTIVINYISYAAELTLEPWLVAAYLKGMLTSK